jgi:NTP pyrophosphatase (non-canonical NTP hydrolase)
MRIAQFNGESRYDAVVSHFGLDIEEEHSFVSFLGEQNETVYSNDEILSALYSDWNKTWTAMHNTMDESTLEQIAVDVIAEVRRAKTMFPANFVNQHEAYAVILEEVDELWDEIKKNQRNYDLAAQRKEAIQAAAMLFRLISELLTTAPDQPEGK